MNQIAKSFFKGMGSINLFPQIPDNTKLPQRTPWQGVAQSFAQTGGQMRAAIKQFNAQLPPKPAK